MTELVINAPHLQTHRQRLGAGALALFGWALWCYFLFPLVSLGCWLMDDAWCSQWVNMAGGYLNLQHMLSIYLHSVCIILLSWMIWLSYNFFVRSLRRRREIVRRPVGIEELSQAFGVSAEQLATSQRSRFAVVHYDGHGHIIGLDQR